MTGKWRESGGMTCSTKIQNNKTFFTIQCVGYTFLQVKKLKNHLRPTTMIHENSNVEKELLLTHTIFCKSHTELTSVPDGLLQRTVWEAVHRNCLEKSGHFPKNT